MKQKPHFSSLQQRDLQQNRPATDSHPELLLQTFKLRIGRKEGRRQGKKGKSTIVSP